MGLALFWGTGWGTQGWRGVRSLGQMGSRPRAGRRPGPPQCFSEIIKKRLNKRRLLSAQQRRSCPRRLPKHHLSRRQPHTSGTQGRGDLTCDKTMRPATCRPLPGKRWRPGRCRGRGRGGRERQGGGLEEVGRLGPSYTSARKVWVLGGQSPKREDPAGLSPAFL